MHLNLLAELLDFHRWTRQAITPLTVETFQNRKISIVDTDFLGLLREIREIRVRIFSLLC